MSNLLGHLYVLQFRSGLVKVGRAGQPDSRITQHRAEGVRHGNPMILRWQSVMLDLVVNAEDRLLKWCRAQPMVVPAGDPGAKGEWFHGLPVDAVIDEAARIAASHSPLDHSDRGAISNREAFGRFVDLDVIERPGPRRGPLPEPPPPGRFARREAYDLAVARFQGVY